MPRESGSVQQDVATFKHLFAFMQWRHGGFLALAIVAACACAAIRTVYAIALGQVFQIITDYGSGIASPPDTLSQISKWCSIICYLGVGALIANSILMTTWVIFGELQARSAREATFHDLLYQKVSWYDGQPEGTPGMLVRIESQVRELQMATSQVFGFLVVDVIASIASLVVAFVLSWQLALVLISTVPLSIVVFYLANRGLGLAINNQKQHLTQASKHANASVTGIDLVKIYDGFNQEVWQYHNTIKAAEKQYLIQSRCNAVQISYMQCWISALFVAGFWFGLWLVTRGANAAQILTTFYAILTALQGLSNAIPQWLVLVRGMSAGQCLKMSSNPGGKRPSEERLGFAPRRCMGDVSFAYPSNPAETILRNTSLHFAPGRTSFIVGKTGSGKSTIGSLLVNFYDPSCGEILIDGRPIEAVKKSWLRQNVTLLQQSSIVLKGTFFENVAIGHSIPDHVSMEEVRRACDMALLQSTVAALPNGMETWIDSFGSSLSGGQIQRLALARARLRDTPVLILDEATSGLDQTSKHLIMEAVRTWRKDKTTIVITHDLSQIGEDEYVYVLDKGCIVQEGTCKTLSREFGSVFAQMYSNSNDGPHKETNHIRNDTSNSGLDFKRNEFGGNSNSYGLGQMSSGSPSLWRTSIEASSAYTHRWGLNAARRRSYAAFSQSAFPRESVYESSEWETIRGSFFEQESPALHDDSTMGAVPSAGHAIQLSRGTSTSTRRHWNDSEAATSNEPEQTSSKIEVKVTRSDNEGTEAKSLGSICQTVWPKLSSKDRLRLIVGLVSCVVAAACNPAFSYCFARLLATFWDTKDQLGASKVWAIYMIIIAIVSGVSMYLERYFMEAVGQAWINSLRLEAMKRILRQSRSWFDRPENSASRISGCFDHDAEEMRNLVARFAPIVLMVAVMVTISTAWSLTISWKLTLVATSVAPVILATIKVLSYTSTKWASTCDEAATKTASFVRECIANIRFTRAFTLDEYFRKRHEKSVKSTYKLGWERGWRLGPLFGLNQSTNYFIIALVFWYGNYLSVDQAEMSPANLQQVVNLLLFCVGQAGSMVNLIPQVSASQAAASRMLRLATTSTDISTQAPSSRLLNSLFPIKMSNLDFAYPSRPEQQSELRDAAKARYFLSCWDCMDPPHDFRRPVPALPVLLAQESQSTDNQLYKHLRFSTMDEIQNKNGGDSNDHGRGDGADTATDGGHIVFVTETPKLNEAKPSKIKSVDWHSGGGIVTRIGEGTTIRTIVKTTSVSESIRTYSDTPQTTTTMKTQTGITEGVTTWFTDMPTATRSVGSTNLPWTTTTIPTTTGGSAPDGDDKPEHELTPIIGGSVGGFLLFMFLVGGLTGLYKLKRTKNQVVVVDFDATAGAGSHSAPQHAHESYNIGQRPQTAMTIGANAGESQAGPSQAGPSQAGASQAGDREQHLHHSHQPMIAELPADTSYCRKLRESHNESV
ncbi:ABC a-pheromone efflux pump [Colletotrichum karsti]|uniref:ABC a-pheromone efflux pump n=1 Tax=Colletotrichum karsti TaxID=1095194 RepID=A0A9P6LLW1_9PEZI|nr:ABC a-pheromone efflux pump [Colletotrichum karsti]KAF9876977.1 ABC a-pheromone efflux pump [Colletotrichum karsti]